MTAAVRAELARLSRQAGIRALLLAQAAIWLVLAVALAVDAEAAALQVARPRRP
jgi:hypothetical protein